MKFAVAVLLGLVSANKVIQSPADIISACDTDGSGGITLDEAHACINKYAPTPEDAKEANDMVDAEFSDG